MSSANNCEHPSVSFSSHSRPVFAIGLRDKANQDVGRGRLRTPDRLFLLRASTNDDRRSDIVCCRREQCP